MKKIFSKNIFIIFLLSIPLLASGALDLEQQMFQSIQQTQPIISTIALETETETPIMGQTVTITARVYSNGGETAGMVIFNWYKDDVYLSKESGQGRSRLSFTAGKTGTNTEIKLIAEISSGSALERIINIKPVDLDLDWQAQTYTDSFSGLKSFASPGSIVKITALPIFGKNEAQNIHYLWSLDEEVDTEQSGAGRQEFFFITRPVLGHSHQIELIAKNPSGTINARKSIFIKLANPEILIYQVKKGGILESGYTFMAKPDEILQFKAVPYSFSTTNFKNLDFKWQLAGKDIATNPERPDIITIRTTKNIPSEGITADLTLEIKNKNNIFQSAEKSVSITIRK